MKKELTMKAVAEIFKLASRINIKPKDIIGMGGDVIKMGTSLFNTKVNPKLTEFINKKGEIPTKIVEQIKVHLRSLKNVSDNQLELFKLNLKDIVNAKFPPTADVISFTPKKTLTKNFKKTGKNNVEEVFFAHPKDPRLYKSKVTSGQTQETGIKQLGTKDYYLNELKVSYPKHYQRLSGKESTAELKEMIYRLDTEGIPFAKGGIANHFRNK